LQEIKNEITIPGEKEPDIIRLLKSGNNIIAVSKDKIFRYNGKSWNTEKLDFKCNTATTDSKGNIWLAGQGFVFNLTENKKIELPAEAKNDTLLCLFLENEKTVLVGTTKGLWSWKGSWAKIAETDGIRVNQIAKGEGEEIWLATSDGIFKRNNNEWLNLNDYVMDAGLLRNFFSIASGNNPGDVIFGSTYAVSKIAADGDHWNFTGEHGLPFGPVTTILQTENELWMGTANGAIKKDAKWHYYNGKRWLPGNKINDIFQTGKNTIWIATDKGISEIAQVDYSFEKKAAYFEKRINNRHLHHNLISDCRFEAPGDTASWSCHTNDNDGLWTSIYLAAECFRYAATGEKEAYDNAVRTFIAMEKLQTVNPIPGFVARSYVAIDESTGHDGEWHVSADGKWKWKGDTSSDEIVGHMFAYPLFYELVAQGEMKERVKAVVQKLMDHIVDNNFHLIDLDGKPTRWGVWSPDSLNGSDEWLYEKGINSLQILSFLESATFVTGDPKFEQACKKLIKEHQYDKNMLVQKMYTPFEINHSDDELSFLPLYGLMRYTKNSELKKSCEKSLLRSWKVEQNDRIPIWNIISTAGLGTDCDMSIAIEELQEYPLDIIKWEIYNSHRWDLRKNPLTDRFGKAQATHPIPVDERGITKWNSNTYLFDYPGNGTSEDDGAAWLLPYWLGIYHKLLR
ncbi:MAG TPA: two-component regulator propeller domain-containing protein, partial [Draconibacterium sp.]|nr:two-component regulator propeller domain-containing protein [Draconibacterium sp.]